jgi:hypothetical protein
MYRKYVEIEIVEAIRALPGKIFTSRDLEEDASLRLGKRMYASNIAHYLKTLESHGYVESISDVDDSNRQYHPRVYKKSHQLHYYSSRSLPEDLRGLDPRVNASNIPSQKEAPKQ